MLLVAGLLWVYWKLYAARHFHGPTAADEQALQRLEAQTSAKPR
jgi:hypothetical protein